jgi:hypothetical protein
MLTAKDPKNLSRYCDPVSLTADLNSKLLGFKCERDHITFLAVLCRNGCRLAEAFAHLFVTVN